MSPKRRPARLDVGPVPPIRYRLNETFRLGQVNTYPEGSIMRIEEVRRLMPGARVLCPSEGEEAARPGVVVSVRGETQEDLFGDPFVWVTVRDPQRGGLAVFPSNLLTAAPARVPQDQREGQDDLFGDRPSIT